MPDWQEGLIENNTNGDRKGQWCLIHDDDEEEEEEEEEVVVVVIKRLGKRNECSPNFPSLIKDNFTVSTEDWVIPK
jgi:uncharacterized UBP type Zn finger protein